MDSSPLKPRKHVDEEGLEELAEKLDKLQELSLEETPGPELLLPGVKKFTVPGEEEGKTRRRKSRAEAFHQTLAKHRGEKMAIIIRGFPDPDSIASALAHKFIAEKFDIECIILYNEDISHQSNKALVKKLEIEIIQFNEDLDLSEIASYALVDTQVCDSPIIDALPKEAKLCSVVDHHKNLALRAEFVDVRENAGSTSSIYTEYLQYGIAELQMGNVEDTRLATALLYGIISDTDNYFLAKPIDFRAAAYLSPFADMDLLRVIATQSISARAMDILERALEKKEIYENYLISGVGFVREEDRDGIAQAADYLLRREGVDTVIVYGIVDYKTIDGSLRTLSNTVDPDKFIKDLFGTNENGKPYGGGRADKGAFQIPVGIFVKCDDRELLWQVIKRTIENIIIEKLGLNVKG